MKAAEATVANAAAAPQHAKLVGDRWVTGDDMDSFNSFCDLDDITDRITGSDDDQNMTKGEVEDVNGQEAIKVSGPDDDSSASAGADTEVISVWIATDDPHHLLRISHTGDEPGTIDMLDYDKPVDATAPAAEDTIDFSQLQSGLGG